jgi:TolB protein
LKKLLLVLFLALLFPAGLSAQKGYLEVSAPGNRQLRMAITTPVSIDGTVRTDLAREIADVLTFDMTLAGPFSVVPVVGEERSGIRPGDFDLAPWRAAGVELLVKSGYSVTGASFTIECRLYDLATARELTAKRYSGTVKDLRRIAHTFSDEIMQVVTGERGPFTGKIAFVSKATGNKELCLMDYDGHNVLSLTRNGSINLNPEFSPTGRELIFTSYKKGGVDLFRREIISGAEARISAGGGINITAAYAPDGNRIALAMSKDGASQIYLISKEGKQLARLTNNNAIDVSPAWSPDGRRLAFVSDRLGRPQIFVMDADGTSQLRLTTSGAYNVSPRWAPKGDRIVYCRQYANEFHIHVINSGGSGDARLTTEGSNEHPRWSPDGRFITFSSSRDGREAIYVMRADGSGQTQVSREKGNDSHPTWSPRW